MPLPHYDFVAIMIYSPERVEGDLLMPRVCFFTGRRTKVGRKIRYRGKPKYQGGIGLKITANEKRKFKPNLHNVRAIIDGKPVRIKVSTKAIKQGLVVKPLKRKYGYTRQQKLLAAG
jgi:large subunit ribosomal protein L28